MANGTRTMKVHPKIKCDICHDKVGETYLATHKRIKHNIRRRDSKKPRTICNICGKDYSASFLVAHQRRDHNIHTRGARANRASKTLSKELVKTSQATDQKQFRILEDLVVLEELTNGGIWLAERVK